MEISHAELALIMGAIMALFKLVEKGAEYLYRVFVKQSDKNKIDTKQEKDVLKIDVLFQEHCKVQAESFATIHNGLNSQANAIKDMEKEMAEIGKSIVRLGTIIEERIPKK